MNILRTISLWSCLATPFAASALTLDDAVQHTLSTHPDVLAARYQTLSREEEVRQAKAGYFPKVDVVLGVGEETTRSPSTGDQEVDLTREEALLQARQMVFDGFLTSSEVTRQKARTSSAKFSGLATQEQVVLRTIEVYLEVLRYAELLDLAQKSLREHQNINDQMELRQKSGVGSKADLDQIQARLALSQSNVIVAETNLADAAANFKRVTGLEPKINDLQQPVLSQPIPASYSAALDLGVTQHPTLMSAAADIDAAEAQYDTAAHNYWPKLQLEVDKTWNKDIDGVVGDNEDLVVALRLRYNLLNGGADKGRRQQTAYLLEESKEIRNNTLRQVEESLRLSWNSYQALQKQMAYLEMHAKAAASTRSAYQKQFNIGKRTLLDLLNTENEVLDSSQSLISAQYDYLFAQYRILNATGTLLNQF